MFYCGKVVSLLRLFKLSKNWTKPLLRKREYQRTLIKVVYSSVQNLKLVLRQSLCSLVFAGIQFSLIMFNAEHSIEKCPFECAYARHFFAAHAL